MLLLYVLAFAAILGLNNADTVTTYESYKVYTVTPSNHDHLAYLKSLEQNADVDFWSDIRRLHESVDVMVSPQLQKEFEYALNYKSIEYSVMFSNVENEIQRERLGQLLSRTKSKDVRIDVFEKYYRHAEINEYLEELAENYPELVELENIGTSLEGRDLVFAKLSTNREANNPIILIDGGIHAREWIAPAVVLYILQQLVENGANNTELLDGVDWYLLPVLNPDGYEFSHTTTRLWRKTRSRGAVCFGTDGNRNFDYFWGTIGASASECDETYRGPVARSEIETRLLETFARGIANRTEVYLSFHSYGPYFLYPWGYIQSPADNGDVQQAVADAAAAAINAYNSSTVYTVGAASLTLYPNSGSSRDWAHGALGIPLSYTVELPGRGYGFLLPIEHVESVVKETFEGVKVFAEYVKTSDGYGKIKDRH